MFRCYAPLHTKSFSDVHHLIGSDAQPCFLACHGRNEIGNVCALYAQTLCGQKARPTTDGSEIQHSVVLRRWRPPHDDVRWRVETATDIILQQHDGRPIAIVEVQKMAKTLDRGRAVRQPHPTVATVVADVQRIAKTDAEIEMLILHGKNKILSETFLLNKANEEPLGQALSWRENVRCQAHILVRFHGSSHDEQHCKVKSQHSEIFGMDYFFSPRSHFFFTAKRKLSFLEAQDKITTNASCFSCGKICGKAVEKPWENRATTLLFLTHSFPHHLPKIFPVFRPFFTPHPPTFLYVKSFSTPLLKTSAYDNCNNR